MLAHGLRWCCWSNQWIPQVCCSTFSIICFHNLSYSPIFAKMCPYWLKPVLDWRTIGIQYPPQSHRFSNQVACLASAAHASRLWYCPAKAIYATRFYSGSMVLYGILWYSIVILQLFHGTLWWFYSEFMMIWYIWWAWPTKNKRTCWIVWGYTDAQGSWIGIFPYIFGCQMTVVWSSLMGIVIGYCILPTLWSGCLRKRGVHPQLTANLMGKMMIYELQLCILWDTLCSNKR